MRCKSGVRYSGLGAPWRSPLLITSEAVTRCVQGGGASLGVTASRK